MKLPGISNVYNLSLKTKNGWKELQKNSSVAAKKGQNFILDNIRPLGANKDAKARWSISASQKPVNRPALPKKVNVDFAKVVNNVWLHKTSGLMPLKGINDKLKSSLSGAKIANSFFQKTSTVSDKDRDTLQARANNLLGRLDNAEEAINRSRRNIFINNNTNKKENREELDSRLRDVFDKATSVIDLSRRKIHKIARTNHYQRNSYLPKTEPYKNQYFDLNKELDIIELEIRSKLKKYKSILDDFPKT
ncbi:hypothetical protein IHE31_02305 (plasmid) [Mycetohabitans rhizoxinica]|uniref:hypothetical protein n=1 Tax=Mycetohabitans rhizoxinica TaxID=412963 RepID=UPI0030CF3DDD